MTTTLTPFSQSDLDKRPLRLWTFTEGRVVAELMAHQVLKKQLKALPKGDGHTVMVLPGFLGGDGSTLQLRKLLQTLGYDVHGWGLGQNTVFSEDRMKLLGSQLKKLHGKTGTTVSLVGWSLGGVFARQLAKDFPDFIRNVITLGSPISGNFNHTFAYKVYKYVNGSPTQSDLDYYSTVNVPPPVPTTSIYSKSDGIVAWRNSIQPETAQTENIRVRASHCGMGTNPNVMKVIADRLSQPEGQWVPYQHKPLKYKLFKPYTQRSKK